MLGFTKLRTFTVTYRFFFFNDLSMIDYLAEGSNYRWKHYDHNLDLKKIYKFMVRLLQIGNRLGFYPFITVNCEICVLERCYICNGTRLDLWLFIQVVIATFQPYVTLNPFAMNGTYTGCISSTNSLNLLTTILKQQISPCLIIESQRLYKTKMITCK